MVGVVLLFLTIAVLPGTAFAMPPVAAAAIATAAAAGTAWVAGVAVSSWATFVVATFAINFSLSALSGALSKKPNSAAPFGREAQDRLEMIRSSVEPRRIIYGQVMVSGAIVFAASSDDGDSRNAFLHLVIALAGHEVEEIGDVYFGDKLASTLSGGIQSPFSGYATITRYLGSTSQTADATLISAFPTQWSSDHRLRGIAYVYVRLKYSQDIFPNGIPTIKAIVKGKKVFDPRDDTTAYSNNWALCVRDYLSSSYGIRADSTEIDDDLVSAAANICDEDVDLVAGGASTQRRYTCDGTITLADKPIDIMSRLLTAGAGSLVYSQGKYRLFAGAYTSPAKTLTISDLRAPITVRASVPRKELYNGVRGTFVDPAQNWQPTDFPIVKNATYATNDGEEILRDIELPFTADSTRAQRIAKIHLEKSRQGIVVDFPAKLTVFDVSVWDRVNITIDALGWSNKVFLVLSWRLSDNAQGIDLTLQEDTSSSYDWSYGDATTLDSAPDTNLPDPFTVQPPGAPQLTEQLYQTIGSSGIKTKAIISWAASPDAFARKYQLEYKLAADSTYIVLPETSDTSWVIPDIEPGSYNLRVKALNALGTSSAYSTATRSVYGLTAVPADIQNFSLNSINDNAHLSWDQVSDADLDVRVGGQIRLRYSGLTTGATWSSAIDVAPAMPGVATQAVVPLMTGTYMAKAVDSSGNESTNAAVIVTTKANITKMNLVATQTEHSSFSGTKTNMVVASGKLNLSGSGPFSTSGSYQFSTYVDTGAVTVSRVTPFIKATTYDSSALFDSRAGDFDDASGLFDGDEITGVDVKFYLRTTNDNPAGSPTWDDWRQFIVGDYSARAFEFKIEVTSANSALNTDIEELGVTVDMPDIVDSGSLTTSDSALTTVSFTKVFTITTPNVGATIQNGATGDYFVISSVTETSFDIGVKDSADSYVARTVAWDAKGY